VVQLREQLRGAQWRRFGADELLEGISDLSVLLQGIYKARPQPIGVRGICSFFDPRTYSIASETQFYRISRLKC